VSILNPITDAGVLAIARSSEPEHFLQALLHVWLRRYFSGAAFMTAGPGGVAEERRFSACDLAWQEDVLPESAQRPVIHLILPDRRIRQRNYSPASHGHDEDWMVDVLVKVPSNLSATAMDGTPEQVVRRVADQVAWLLGSPERDSLTAHGVTRIRLQRPPAILPASLWQMRMLVFSCRTRREQSSGR